MSACLINHAALRSIFYLEKSIYTLQRWREIRKRISLKQVKCHARMLLIIKLILDSYLDGITLQIWHNLALTCMICELFVLRRLMATRNCGYAYSVARVCNDSPVRFASRCIERTHWQIDIDTHLIACEYKFAYDFRLT